MEGGLISYLQNVNDNKSLKFYKFQDTAEIILHEKNIFPN